MHSIDLTSPRVQCNEIDCRHEVL